MIEQPYSMCTSLGHPLAPVGLDPDVLAGRRRPSMVDLLAAVGCQIESLPRAGGGRWIDFGQRPIGRPRYVLPKSHGATLVQQLQTRLAGLGGPGLNTRDRQSAARLN